MCPTDSAFRRASPVVSKTENQNVPSNARSFEDHHIFLEGEKIERESRNPDLDSNPEF